MTVLFVRYFETRVPLHQIHNDDIVKSQDDVTSQSHAFEFAALPKIVNRNVAVTTPFSFDPGVCTDVFLCMS